MVTRVLDIAVLLLLAFAILMPRPDARAKPAMSLPPEQRDRVAELQMRLLADDDDVDAALELANIFLDARRPEWAVAVASHAIEARPDDHRLHQLRSLALADHFEPAPAYAAALRALALCESGSQVKCGDGEHGRIQLLRDTLARVKDLDMRKDPNTAKEQILRALRPAYIPKKRAPKASDAGTLTPPTLSH